MTDDDEATRAAVAWMGGPAGYDALKAVLGLEHSGNIVDLAYERQYGVGKRRREEAERRSELAGWMLFESPHPDEDLVTVGRHEGDGKHFSFTLGRCKGFDWLALMFLNPAWELPAEKYYPARIEVYRGPKVVYRRDGMCSVFEAEGIEHRQLMFAIPLHGGRSLRALGNLVNSGIDWLGLVDPKAGTTGFVADLSDIGPAWRAAAGRVGHAIGGGSGGDGDGPVAA